MFCHKCGTKNPEDALYCFKCGADLSRVTTSPDISGPTISEPIDQIIPKNPKEELIKRSIPYTADKFFKSVLDGDIEAVKLFLLAGMNPNLKDTVGHTPLMFAAQNGHVGIVKLLLEDGANVNEQNNNGSTALMRVIDVTERQEIRKLLIAAGANINIKDRYGVTALYLALVHPNSLNLLLQYKADVNIKFNLAWAVYAYVQLDRSKTPRQLAEAIANRANEDWTPLMSECSRNNVEVVKILLSHGAGATVNAKNGIGKTALMLAQEKGNTEIVRLLQNNGARNSWW